MNSEVLVHLKNIESPEPKKLKSAVFHASTRMMSIGNQKSPLQNSFSEE